MSGGHKAQAGDWSETSVISVMSYVRGNSPEWVESRRGTVGLGSSSYWFLSGRHQCLNPSHSP